MVPRASLDRRIDLSASHLDYHAVCRWGCGCASVCEHWWMARSKRSEPAAVDVLAAEEFGVPAPDPALRPEKLVLPPDPVADKPHDVLAAEAFAMPSPEEAHKVPTAVSRRNRAAIVVGLNTVPLVVAWLVRRARRGRKTEA